MQYFEFDSAAGFLDLAAEALERFEAVNGLMLGVALRLEKDPCAYGSLPFMAAVESGGSLTAGALMTPPYKLQLFMEAGAGPAAVGLLAEKLSRGGWSVPGVIARRDAAEAFAESWCGITGASMRRGMLQGVHELSEVEHSGGAPGVMRKAEVADLDLVRGWAHCFHDDCFDDGLNERSAAEAEEKIEAGGLYLWVDREPVSMAARTRPTPHGEAVSFVYTPPRRRRRGYATSLVAALSGALLDEGREFCTLYTDLANPVSNSIYRRIGYRMVAEVMDIHFRPEGDG